MTKDSLKLSASLPIIYAARKYVDMYSSKADDSNTSERKTKFFLNRILNSSTGCVEVSSTQIASMLLQSRSYDTSNEFIYIFPYAALKCASIMGDQVLSINEGNVSSDNTLFNTIDSSTDDNIINADMCIGKLK